MNESLKDKLQQAIVKRPSEKEMFEQVIVMLGLSERQLSFGNIFPKTYDDPFVGTLWALWQCRAHIETINTVNRNIVGSMKN